MVSDGLHRAERWPDVEMCMHVHVCQLTIFVSRRLGIFDKCMAGHLSTVKRSGHGKPWSGSTCIMTPMTRYDTKWILSGNMPGGQVSCWPNRWCVHGMGGALQGLYALPTGQEGYFGVVSLLQALAMRWTVVGP